MLTAAAVVVVVLLGWQTCLDEQANRLRISSTELLILTFYKLFGILDTQDAALFVAKLLYVQGVLYLPHHRWHLCGSVRYYKGGDTISYRLSKNKLYNADFIAGKIKLNLEESNGAYFFTV